MIEFYNRAPPSTLLINCIRAPDGLFHHKAYMGKVMVRDMAFDAIVTDEHWLQAMRKKPIEFCEAHKEIEDANG